MDPHAALDALCNLLNAATMIAKPNGTESGLTQGDRIQIGQMAAAIKGALPPQETPQGADSNGKQTKREKVPC